MFLNILAICFISILFSKKFHCAVDCCAVTLCFFDKNSLFSESSIRNELLVCQYNSTTKCSGYHCSVSAGKFERFFECHLRGTLEEFLLILPGQQVFSGIIRAHLSTAPCFSVQDYAWIEASQEYSGSRHR